MVINSIICRAILAYNVTLYTNIAKEKGIQCAEEANITHINRYFSLTTPYTIQCFSSLFGDQKSKFLFLIEINEIGVITHNIVYTLIPNT